MLLLGLPLALAGCLAFEGRLRDTPRPAPRPAGGGIVEPSQASLDLARYYGALEQDLLTRGLLRGDGGGPDTPYDSEDLARNFELLAFSDEYARPGADSGGGLARWQRPIRMSAVFGPSVPQARRQGDRRQLSDYAARLSRVTGHAITMGANGNFTVIYAGLDDADFVESTVRRLLPGLRPQDIALFAAPPRSIYCLVFAGGSAADPLSYTHGVALIRAEHPDLMRESCVHEEVAQGLGLRNDSPKARPSIFNDDDEFARLTSHDEKLLQMLYDPRLRVGMSAPQARPTVERIAREIMDSQITGSTRPRAVSASISADDAAQRAILSEAEAGEAAILGLRNASEAPRN